MLFKNISIIDENFDVKNNIYVGISGKTIDYIGDKMPDNDYGETYDGNGKLLMPAFFNAHGHSPMTLMRGYGENMNLQDWLFKRIFPFEDKLDRQSVFSGTLLSMAESIRYGIVSTSDMYYFTDDMVAAYIQAGVKGNISRAISHFDESDPWEGERLKEMKRTFEAYNGMENGRILIDISLHAEYTNNEKSMRAVCDYANEVGSRMHTHISETKKEHEECKAKYGKTPVELFNSFGAWNVPAVAAHCVWIEGDDYDILKDNGVTVASNPVSNMKLASGVCNVPKLLKRKINVAIGTDSVASNNSLDFFEEMKVFAMASKMYYNDPTVVTPKETIYAATRAGALAQGRKNSGLIKKGFDADLIVIDIDKPNMKPVYDMMNNLVYSASGTDVVLTMCDGRILYENGEYKTIDVERTYYMVDESVKRILSRL